MRLPSAPDSRQEAPVERHHVRHPSDHKPGPALAERRGGDRSGQVDPARLDHLRLSPPCRELDGKRRAFDQRRLWLILCIPSEHNAGYEEADDRERDGDRRGTVRRLGARNRGRVGADTRRIAVARNLGSLGARSWGRDGARSQGMAGMDKRGSRAVARQQRAREGSASAPPPDRLAPFRARPDRGGALGVMRAASDGGRLAGARLGRVGRGTAWSRAARDPF